MFRKARHYAVEMLTSYVITCVFVPDALSQYSHACTFSYRFTAHVWFACVFEHSFSCVCVALRSFIIFWV